VNPSIREKKLMRIKKSSTFSPTDVSFVSEKRMGSTPGKKGHGAQKKDSISSRRRTHGEKKTCVGVWSFGRERPLLNPPNGGMETDRGKPALNQKQKKKLSPNRVRRKKRSAPGRGRTKCSLLSHQHPLTTALTFKEKKENLLAGRKKMGLVPERRQREGRDLKGFGGSMRRENGRAFHHPVSACDSDHKAPPPW